MGLITMSDPGNFAVTFLGFVDRPVRLKGQLGTELQGSSNIGTYPIAVALRGRSVWSAKGWFFVGLSTNVSFVLSRVRFVAHLLFVRNIPGSATCGNDRLVRPCGVFLRVVLSHGEWDSGRGCRLSLFRSCRRSGSREVVNGATS